MPVSSRHQISAVIRTTALFLALVGGPIQAVAQQQPPTSPPPQPTSGTGTATTPVGRTAAQEAATAKLGRTVSNSEIAKAISTSGLSPQQVRDRLRSAGYDPALADPFLGGTTTNDEQAANPGFVAALQQLGMLGSIGESASEVDEEGVPRRAVDRVVGGSSMLFGKNFFTQSASVFDSPANGAIDPAYRLGAGDQLQLVVTGDVEVAYALEVRRDGTLIVPVIGQVNVGGLTLEAARSVLRQRAKNVYSSVAEGKGTVDLSVARTRSVLVYVIGEVEKPGAYQVGALSSPLTALARAGGPTTRGSFREVHVTRGGRQVAVIDLYDYLIDGRLGNSYRVEQGDIISVPPSKMDVALGGAVRRNGIFQLLPTEHLGDLLHFGGGLLTTASTRRVQIDRVLPPQYRTPGRDRVVQDIFLDGSSPVLDTLTLLPDDRVLIFSIGDLRRNTVSVKGEVFQPGTYELRDSMSVKDVIDRADGLLPWALADRIKVIRSDAETGGQRIFSLDFADPAARAFKLQEYDEISVLDARKLLSQADVAVTGAVNSPTSLAFRIGMTLADAIDLAGGLREEASLIEVARRRKVESYSDTLGVVFTSQARVPTDSAFRAFQLQGGDQVAVRTSPGYRATQTVQLTGAFVHPGTYTLLSDHERISEVIARAGGLLPTAYTPSFRLVRSSKSVAVDYAGVVKNTTADNIVMQANDIVRVGVDPGVVFVGGAVSKPVAVPYRSSLKVSDYLELAGGPLPGASSTYLIEGPSGRITRSRRVLRMSRTNERDIQAGSIITVVPEPVDKNSVSTLSTILQLATTVVTLAIGLRAIR